MEIALLNERITFQRNSVLTDRIGSHTSSWNDEFSCYATVGGESGRNGKETAVAGTTVEDADCTFILFNHKIVDKIYILMYNVNGDEK